MKYLLKQHDLFVLFLFSSLIVKMSFKGNQYITCHLNNHANGDSDGVPRSNKDIAILIEKLG